MKIQVMSTNLIKLVHFYPHTQHGMSLDDSFEIEEKNILMYILNITFQL